MESEEKIKKYVSACIEYIDALIEKKAKEHASVEMDIETVYNITGSYDFFPSYRANESRSDFLEKELKSLFSIREKCKLYLEAVSKNDVNKMRTWESKYLPEISNYIERISGEISVDNVPKM